MTTANEAKRPRATRSAGGSRKPAVTQATADARRRASAVLEVLAGVRTPTQAAETLAVSVPRYYLLEQRAIGGLVSACEPAPRGPQVNGARRVAALEREVARLKHESSRHQALARATQRTLGLAPPPTPRPPVKGAKGATEGKSRRRRKPTVRALTLAKALAPNANGGNSSGTGPSADVQQAAATG